MLATDDEEVEITKKREKMTGSRAFLQLTKNVLIGFQLSSRNFSKIWNWAGN